MRRARQRQDRGLDDVVRGGAAREVADGSSEPLQQRARGARTSEMLHQFVRDVGGLEAGEHEHIGTPCDRTHLTEFLAGDPLGQRGVGFNL